MTHPATPEFGWEVKVAMAGEVFWRKLWNKDPADDTVVLIMTQVGDDGAFPYI